MKQDANAFCTNQLDTLLDLTMWNDKLQVQSCVHSLSLLSDLTESSVECVNNPDAEECDPCTKHYDFFFDKYDVFVLNNILRVIQKVSEMD